MQRFQSIIARPQGRWCGRQTSQRKKSSWWEEGSKQSNRRDKPPKSLILLPLILIFHHESVPVTYILDPGTSERHEALGRPLDTSHVSLILALSLFLSLACSHFRSVELSPYNPPFYREMPKAGQFGRHLCKSRFLLVLVLSSMAELE